MSRRDAGRDVARPYTQQLTPLLVSLEDVDVALGNRADVLVDNCSTQVGKVQGCELGKTSSQKCRR